MPTRIHFQTASSPRSIPANTGLNNITSGVTINGNGWAAITAPANGNGITINAGSGNVTLIGLEIDGAGAAYDGIVDNSAGSLTVTNCTLQNFIYDEIHGTTGNGILMQPASGALDFTITNTNASNNGFVGIAYLPPSGSPSANGVIDHVTADANQYGIAITTVDASGGTAAVTVSNSIASDNRGNGIDINNSGSSSTIALSIDNVSLSGNHIGARAAGTANVLLGRSVITANTVYGVFNETSSNTLYSYGNNQINLNGAGPSDDVNGTMTSDPLK